MKNPALGNTKKFLSTSDLGDQLRIPRNKITEICRRGIIKGVKKENNKWIIPQKAVSKFKKILFPQKSAKIKLLFKKYRIFPKIILIAFSTIIMVFIFYLNWLIKPHSYNYDFTIKNPNYFNIKPVYNSTDIFLTNEEARPFSDYSFYCEIYFFPNKNNAYVKLHSDADIDIKYELNEFGLPKEIKCLNRITPTFIINWPGDIELTDDSRFWTTPPQELFAIEKLENQTVINSYRDDFFIDFIWNDAFKRLNLFQKKIFLPIAEKTNPFYDWDNTKIKYSINIRVQLPYNYKIKHQSILPISSSLADSNTYVDYYEIRVATHSNRFFNYEILLSEGNFELILEKIDAEVTRNTILLIIGILIGIIGNVLTHLVLALAKKKAE